MCSITTCSWFNNPFNVRMWTILHWLSLKKSPTNPISSSHAMAVVFCIVLLLLILLILLNLFALLFLFENLTISLNMTILAIMIATKFSFHLWLACRFAMPFKTFILTSTPILYDKSLWSIYTHVFAPDLFITHAIFDHLQFNTPARIELLSDTTKVSQQFGKNSREVKLGVHYQGISSWWLADSPNLEIHSNDLQQSVILWTLNSLASWL